LIIQPPQFSLAVPLWTDMPCAGDAHDHCWGKNDEFCVGLVVVGPAYAGILTYSGLKTLAVN